MSDIFGFTRSVVKREYALLTPAGFVNSVLPGWQDAQAVVVVSPAMGARFSQVLLTLGASGRGSGGMGEIETFVLVLDGALVAASGDAQHELAVGGYAFLPAGQPYTLESASEATRLLLFQRRYVAQIDSDTPTAVFGNEREVEGVPFLGDEAALLKTLLPDAPAFDMAVNIFTFQPGATLPVVETHIMEHGLLMIQGQGIYRLGSDWHPVQAGDVIWMASYCPQWFVATGKTSARYVYYKDVNRAALV